MNVFLVVVVATISKISNCRKIFPLTLGCSNVLEQASLLPVEPLSHIMFHLNYWHGSLSLKSPIRGEDNQVLLLLIILA